MTPLPPFLLALLLSPPGLPHWRPVPPETARTSLGFSGATLSVRSIEDAKRPGTARRLLTLTAANGTRRRLILHDGGGYLRNNALNLYHLARGKFLLASERDCVAIDPIRPSLRRCLKQQACSRTRLYLGRFDWMNGFDPPRGEFRYAFRFLPTYDALESGGC